MTKNSTALTLTLDPSPQGEALPTELHVRGIPPGEKQPTTSRTAPTIPRPTAPHPGGVPIGSLDQAPPFALPGEHFAAGLVWLALGAAGLVAVVPSLVQGNFLLPRVIAVTHCFTLGWITTSIFGALYQLFPVVLGAPARSVRVGHATFWVLQAGVVSLVAGTWWWRPPLIAAGWVVLFLAVGGLAWNVLPQRRRAPRGRVIGLYISAGHMALGFAMAVVAARIGDALGWWQIDRLGLLAAHAHLAVVGFATLTAVSVGSRLLPMFLLSHGHAEWPLRWIGPVVGAGLALFTAGELLASRALVVAGAVAVAAGLALYLALVGGYFARRVRRQLDPGLAHVAAAFIYLALATALGLLVFLTPGFRPRLIVSYALAGIVGWLSLLIVGIYQKIVPFLTWLHRFAARVGEPGVPRIADLTVPAVGWTMLVLFAGSLLLLLAGIAAGAGVLARAGAAGFAAATALLVGQHARLALRR